jgi:hypothetical protein
VKHFLPREKASTQALKQAKTKNVHRKKAEIAKCLPKYRPFSNFCIKKGAFFKDFSGDKKGKIRG